MELCFHVDHTFGNHNLDKTYFLTSQMTKNVTWPTKVGDPILPLTNYTEFFSSSNSTTSFTKSFENLEADNTTKGNLTKWCL